MHSSFQFQSPDIHQKGLAVYNAEQAPFSLHGLYRERQNGILARLPRAVAEQTNKRVSVLYTNTAGVRLRFATDSAELAIGALYSPMEFPSERTVALCGASACCFDLYVDGRHSQVMFHKRILKSQSSVCFDLSDGHYESAISFEDRRMRQITLFFPSFVDVADVFVGLEPNARLEAADPYVNELPVVFYGSSITQGACASRSGNTYPSILSRKFNFDYLNLGFAGACKAEPAIIDYLCALPMHLLVYDYDHNAPSVEYLRDTHLPALRKLRTAHPDIPIVLLSKPNRHNGKEIAIERRDIVKESYLAMKREGDFQIHFVDGQEIFESLDTEMMTIDNTHPTDLGFYCMAKALEEIFKLYF